MTDPNTHPGVVEAQRARSELYDTLGQLRDRLDYAQRIDDSIARAKRRVTAERRENPVGFAIGAVAVAAVAGVTAWGVTRLIVRAFR